MVGINYVKLYKTISHHGDVILGSVASQITSLTIGYSTVYSDADQRKHQSSASLAFERGIHQEPVNSLHKWPVMRKIFLFDDVIMVYEGSHLPMLHIYSLLHRTQIAIMHYKNVSEQIENNYRPNIGLNDFHFDFIC